MTGGQQDEIVRRLRAAGVAARYGFKPMHTQPEYAGSKPVLARYGGKAADASREVVYFPLDPHLLTNNDDLAKTCFGVCRAVLGEGLLTRPAATLATTP